MHTLGSGWNKPWYTICKEKYILWFLWHQIIPIESSYGYHPDCTLLSSLSHHFLVGNMPLSYHDSNDSIITLWYLPCLSYHNLHHDILIYNLYHSHKVHKLHLYTINHDVTTFFFLDFYHDFSSSPGMFPASERHRRLAAAAARSCLATEPSWGFHGVWMGF